MTVDEFFDEPREQSLIKSRIVSKYFSAWARIMIPRARDNRIAYMDLFAGPGRYTDGTPSTPIRVLQTAVKDHNLKRMLVTYFNDKKLANARSLQEAINQIPLINTLSFKPVVAQDEVGEKIAAALQRMALVPTLLFVDPWGYKGLSLALLSSVLKDWGCDCIFFFNYNRVNPGINNEIVREHMEALFGVGNADAMRAKLSSLDPDEREVLVLEELSESLLRAGAAYVLPFTFKNESGKRTSHHLILATKNFTGYEIMKEIMAKESTDSVVLPANLDSQGLRV